MIPRLFRLASQAGNVAATAASASSPWLTLTRARTSGAAAAAISAAEAAAAAKAGAFAGAAQAGRIRSPAAAASYFVKRWPRHVRWLVGAGAALVVIQPTASDLRLAYLIPARLALDVYTAAAIVADYKMSLGSLTGPAREEALHACHQRGAQRLLQLCFANGGIYTKLGQHIGQLDHLLPEEYVNTMKAHLLDKCPVSSAGEVRKIFVEDFGRAPEQIFAYWNPRPFASASLAQVHEARDHAGQRLAVKVQHAGLRESSAADIATVSALVNAVRWVFPDFDYNWLVDEIKDNLPRELDFRHEASNAERCRANLAASTSGAPLAGRVHIPSIDYRTTSHRVLTMEFVDGVGVTDVPKLRRLGTTPQQVSRLVAEVFSRMVFELGDIHCDPHAANMLVRKTKDGVIQLVLLDHGLYKQITDAFRLEYAALWRSLIFADAEGIKRHSAAMNAGDAYPIFAAMLTQRPWDQIVEARADHLRTGRPDEMRGAAAAYMARFAREISDLLSRMPRPLLLLLKTNDCLRSVDHCLGQPTNTLVITARQCAAALARERLAGHPGPLVRLGVAWEMAQVELRMAALHAMVWVAWLRRRVGLQHPKRGNPLEEGEALPLEELIEEEDEQQQQGTAAAAPAAAAAGASPAPAPAPALTRA